MLQGKYRELNTMASDRLCRATSRTLTQLPAQVVLKFEGGLKVLS